MTSQQPQSLSYKQAGVDIDAGNSLVERIKPFAAKTRIPGVLAGLGGFGSLFEIPLDRYQQPVLVSGTDGVGTKLKLAFDLNMHKTVGIDLVAMCVNDIIVQGAEPLFFLDYFATGKLDVDTAADVVKGIADGCLMAGAALVGGETAEMPGMYPDGEYDLAGFCVGIAEKERIIDGSKVKPGDQLLGLASSGPHSNGYSLIRKIIELKQPSLQSTFGNSSLAEVLMQPTRIYIKSLLHLMQHVPVHALAHITGGGITENLPRVLSDDLAANINLGAWETPEIFNWLQQQGNISDADMLTTFNCGLGMIVCVSQENAGTAKEMLELQGEQVFTIGEIISRDNNAVQIRYA